MTMETLTALHLSGLIAILGALIFAIGDVVLLGTRVGPRRDPSVIKVDLKTHPKFQRQADEFEGLALMPWSRLVGGGLLGVFAAPLTLAGAWLMYQGLSPAGPWAALPPALLFTFAIGIGPFIHGFFIFLGQTVQTLNAVDEDSRPVLIEALLRQQSLLIICYVVLLSCAVLTSIWFSVAVALGHTALPLWMAAVNPVTVTIVWLALKKILPQKIKDYTEGAGFNVANVIFFLLLTVTQW